MLPQKALDLGGFFGRTSHIIRIFTTRIMKCKGHLACMDEITVFYNSSNKTYREDHLGDLSVEEKM
jgi:hypothetical protein